MTLGPSVTVAEPRSADGVSRRVTTPDDLRKEANAAEFLARLVSYARDKQWLAARAADLRRQADLLEQRSWAPDGRPDDAEDRRETG